MIRLDLLNVGLVEETGGILLVLRAENLDRLLVIETGMLEGRAIALEAGGVRSERPLTQDLLYDTILRLGARIKEVLIPEFRDETFFARIVLHRPDGMERVIELDARPSDAIALAMRAEAPIYVADEILEEMGLPADPSGRFGDLFAEDDTPGPRVLH